MRARLPKTDQRILRGAKARAGILQAAIRVFAESGLEGARTEAIAEAAGVNKALIFYHFKSKKHLFRAVIEDVHRPTNEKFIALLSNRKPAAEILFQYVDLFVDRITDYPESVRVSQRALMMDSKLADRMMERYFFPRLERLAALIRRGVKEGDFRPVDAFQAAIAVTALLVFPFLGAALFKKAEQYEPFEKANLQKHRQMVKEFLRYGLFRHPEGRHHDA
jgi:TetR/AcrR family transcriptional regulator